MHRLIIVEDEERILQGMKELYPWENMGFEVAGVFLRATDALDYLKQHPVDVVLTDLNMPEMDGITFTEQLAEYKDLIIVYFSSHQDYAYMRAAIQNRITDYLLKPISYEDLVNCFTRISETLSLRQPVETATRQATYYEEIIRRVDAYLAQNIRSATLSGAAELVGLSPNYLSTLYRGKVGIGFQEKLNQLRMEKARELLLNPEFKNYEIAFHVGYDNPKNFTRAFKAYYGVSPRDYRCGSAAGRNDEE